MKTLAFIFSYNRGATLRACISSLQFYPADAYLIDDGSTDDEARRVIDAAERDGILVCRKETNRGFSDSVRIAYGVIQQQNPDFVFFIEGDYVFRKGGLDAVMDCLTNTPEGDTCLGIAGYDHPNQRQSIYTDHIFPNCMKAQVGEDNVNRAALYKPRMVQQRFSYSLELVSNTCFTSYLHWSNIMKVAAEFPELNDLLNQACSPRENPNYPDSGKYKAQRTVDDGMLSHALSLCWNRYALKHQLDRDRFGAWLNIRPSVAEHRFQGGTNFS